MGESLTGGSRFFWVKVLPRKFLPPSKRMVGLIEPSFFASGLSASKLGPLGPFLQCGLNVTFCGVGNGLEDLSGGFEDGQPVLTPLDDPGRTWRDPS